jgi:hypothetical protein
VASGVCRSTVWSTVFAYFCCVNTSTMLVSGYLHDAPASGSDTHGLLMPAVRYGPLPGFNQISHRFFHSSKSSCEIKREEGREREGGCGMEEVGGAQLGGGLPSGRQRDPPVPP